MTKAGRIPCEVLGCRRTAPMDKHEPGTRICCGKCWRLGSSEARSQYATAHKIIRKLEALELQGRLLPEEVVRISGFEGSMVGAERWASAMFWRVVREATEARVGLA